MKSLYPIKKWKLIIPLFLLSLSLMSCMSDTKDSTNIDDENIYIDIEVIEKVGSTNTKITVTPRKNNVYGKSIELVEGEYITAQFGDTQIILSKKEWLLGIDYEGHINTGGEAGLFKIVFHRIHNRKISSEIEMPPAFEVAVPSEFDTYHEGNSLNVTWSPALSGGEMNIDGHIACRTIDDDLSLDIDNEHESWTTSDTGNYDFPLGKLASNMRLEILIEDDLLVAGKPCSFDIKVYRENRKNLSTNYATGSVITAKKTAVIGNMNFYINP